MRRQKFELHHEICSGELRILRRLTVRLIVEQVQTKAKNGGFLRLPCGFNLKDEHNFSVHLENRTTPTLNGFIPQIEPKRPNFCGECRNYDRFKRQCKLDSHSTKPDTSACNHAIGFSEARRAY